MEKRRTIGIAILSIGILLIVAGVFRGELNAIMQKAVLVCMECIGLG